MPPAYSAMPAVVAPGYSTIPPIITPPMPPSAAVEVPVEAVAEVPGMTVTAPMVGTFYGSPSPKEPPYVRVGDEVKPGDVLGIIEAMKIMNEIECEVHGRVVRVLVETGQPVEYGQSLMLIEPL